MRTYYRIDGGGLGLWCRLPPNGIKSKRGFVLNGLTENYGHENDGPSKLQDMKLQDMKMTDQVAWHEIARHEIARHETGGQTAEK